MSAKRKPVAEPVPACPYCHGKGLSASWHRLGYRIAIGERMTKDTEAAIPCDRCGQPVNNEPKRTNG